MYCENEYTELKSKLTKYVGGGGNIEETIQK